MRGIPPVSEVDLTKGRQCDQSIVGGEKGGRQCGKNMISQYSGWGGGLKDDQSKVSFDADHFYCKL